MIWICNRFQDISLIVHSSGTSFLLMGHISWDLKGCFGNTSRLCEIWARPQNIIVELELFVDRLDNIFTTNVNIRYHRQLCILWWHADSLRYVSEPVNQLLMLLRCDFTSGNYQAPRVAETITLFTTLNFEKIIFKNVTLIWNMHSHNVSIHMITQLNDIYNAFVQQQYCILKFTKYYLTLSFVLKSYYMFSIIKT
jgi:hypothetical protein